MSSAREAPSPLSIVFVNHYASTPETGFAGRTFYLARALAKSGHNVVVLAASFTHIQRDSPQVRGWYREDQIDGVRFVWLKTLRYGAAHSNVRILGWFKFLFQVVRYRRRIAGRVDVVVCSSPSLVSFLGARRLARRSGAKLVFEVRDIWPLTLVELGGHPTKHPFIRFLQWIEDGAYRDSDAVISNLPLAVDHMRTRGMDTAKFAWIPNGVDVDELTRAEPLPADVRSRVPEGKFVIGYTGTIGEANAMQTFLDAADLLRDRSEIAFVMIGDGKDLPSLKATVVDRNLSNVHFVSSIPKRQVQGALELFDACYLGSHRSELYRFGLGANKLPEYMYAQRPVLLAYSGRGEFVSDADAGIVVPADDPEAVASAVLALVDATSDERQMMGARGRQFVVNELDYKVLAERLLAAITAKR